MTQFRCSRSQLITEKDTLPGVSLIHYKYPCGVIMAVVFQPVQQKSAGVAASLHQSHLATK